MDKKTQYTMTEGSSKQASAVVAAPAPASALGKLAAIRQIMRERQKKRDGTADGERDEFHQHDTDSSDGSVGGSDHGMMRVAPIRIGIGIPHAVSMDDDVVAVDEDDCGDLQLPREVLEQSMNSGTDSDESQASSYWMLMEHGLDNSADGQHVVENIVAARNLMETTLLSVAPSPEKATSFLSIQSPQRASSDEIEPNVSWNEEDDEGSGCDIPTVQHVDDAIDEQKSVSSHSLSSDDAVKSALSGSPFTTFRQNSTNIALHESEAYVLRIQELEEALARAQQQAVGDKAELRLDLERKLSSKTPVRRYSTPGNAQISSGKSWPTTTSRQSKLSTATSVSNESLWERNKTLVTEIRFADQTCVELSLRKTTLEQQVEQLRSANDKLSATNQSLLDQLHQANCDNARNEAELEALRRRLQSAEMEALPPPSPRQYIELESQLDHVRQALTERDGEVDLLRDENTRLSRQLSDAHEMIDTELQELHGNGTERKNETKAFDTAGPSTDTAMLEEQAEQFQNEIDDMVLRISDERAGVVEKVGRVALELQARSKELAEAVVGKVRQLEHRLAVCGDAVKQLEALLNGRFKSRDEVMWEANHDSFSSSGCDLEVTFSRRDHSADLSMMEEARVNEIRRANETRHSAFPILNVDTASAASTNDGGANIEGTMGHDESHDEMSALSESHVWSPRSGGSFHQHLQWLVSPNAIHNPADTPAAVADDVSQSNGSDGSDTAKEKESGQPDERSMASNASPVESAAKSDKAMISEKIRGSEASDRKDALRGRLDALQQTKVEAEAALGQKSIFPRNRDDLGGGRSTSLQGERQASMRSLNAVIETLTENQAKYSRRVMELESSLQLVKDELERAHDDMTALSDKCDVVEKERDHYRALSKIHFDTIGKLQEELQSMNDKLASTDSVVVDLRASVKKANERRDDLSLANSELKATVASHLEALDEARANASDTESRHVEATRQLNARYLEAGQSRDAMIAERDALLQRVEDLVSEVHGIDETLGATTADLVAMKALLRKEEQSKQESAALATQYLIDLKAAIAELNQSKAQVVDIKDAAKRAEALVQQEHSTAEELARNLSECQDRITILLSQLDRSSELLEASRDEAAQLRSQKETMATKCHRLRDYIRKLTSKCDEWESFHEREASAVQQLKSAYETAVAQATQLADACENRENMYSFERKKVGDLEHENQRLENELSVIVRELSTLTNAPVD